MLRAETPEEHHVGLLVGSGEWPEHRSWTQKSPQRRAVWKKLLVDRDSFQENSCTEQLLENSFQELL